MKEQGFFFFFPLSILKEATIFLTFFYWQRFIGLELERVAQSNKLNSYSRSKPDSSLYGQAVILLLAARNCISDVTGQI